MTGITDNTPIPLGCYSKPIEKDFNQRYSSNKLYDDDILTADDINENILKNILQKIKYIM